jgi:hypothetical protein
MTAVPKNPRVSELRELFRNLLAFRSVYEETGLEDIQTPDGRMWSLWDLEYLRSQLHRLTLRQRQAITLCLIHNIRERDAAVTMGVSETNPVSMYATLGLQRLLDMVDSGELTRFRERRLAPVDLAARHESSFATLVKEIESRLLIVENGCWIYPNRSPRPPKLLLRSPRAASGFMILSPMNLLYEFHIGKVAPGIEIPHSKAIPAFSISCINPYHGELPLPSGRKEALAS